jgi:hypothetical protein
VLKFLISPAISGCQNLFIYSLLIDVFNYENGTIALKFEVFTTVTMKNAAFWDVTSCRTLRTDALEEGIAPIIRVKSISELSIFLARCFFSP